MSRVLLSVIYFVVVFPVGLFRRIIGKDSLKLKSFKKNIDSAFVTRDKLFTEKDLQTPY